jgi:hypothetical protein
MFMLFDRVWIRVRMETRTRRRRMSQRRSRAADFCYGWVR